MKNLSRNSRIAEVADTSKRMVLLFDETTGVHSDPVLQPTFQDIRTLSSELSEIIKSDKIVSELDNADTTRDEAVRKLEKLLKGYEVISVEDMQQAAKRLYKVFSKYGISIVRESYTEESAHIEALLKDLLATEYTADIDLLTGVRDSIDTIQRSQESFNKQRLDYEKAVAEKASKTKSQTLKKELLNKINHVILPYVFSAKNAHLSHIENFADAIIQIVADTNAVVEGRTKKK